MSDAQPADREEIITPLPAGGSGAAHHPKCYQTLGVPQELLDEGLPSTLCDCRTLFILDCPAHQPRQHRDGKPPWCDTCGWSDPRQAKPARHKDDMPGLSGGGQ